MFYPRDMLFARALSRLARQLFSDVISETYVIGEISSEEEVLYEDDYSDKYAKKESLPEPSESASISAEQVLNLRAIIKSFPEYEQRVEKFLQEKGINNWSEMPLELYETIVKKITDLVHEESKEIQNV